MKRNAKEKSRKAKRKEQSLRDRTENYWKLGKDLSDPLADYRIFIDRLRMRSRTSMNDFFKIPVNLVELTASIFDSLISRKRFQTANNGHVYKGSAVSDKSDKSPTSPPSKDRSKCRPENTMLLSFISQIIRASQLSCTTFLLAVILILRWDGSSTRRPHSRHSSSEHLKEGAAHTYTYAPSFKNSEQEYLDMFVGAIITSDKYLYDATYSNKAWIELLNYKYTLDEINLIERNFLRGIHFNLFVSEEEFIEFLDYLDWLICIRQLSKWESWPTLTYRDLLRLSNMRSPLRSSYQFTIHERVILFISKLVVASIRLVMVFVVLSALSISLNYVRQQYQNSLYL